MEMTSGMRLKEAPRKDRQTCLKSLKTNGQRAFGQADDSPLRGLSDRGSSYRSWASATHPPKKGHEARIRAQGIPHWIRPEGPEPSVSTRGGILEQGERLVHFSHRRMGRRHVHGRDCAHLRRSALELFESPPPVPVGTLSGQAILETIDRRLVAIREIDPHPSHLQELVVVPLRSVQKLQGFPCLQVVGGLHAHLFEEAYGLLGTPSQPELLRRLDLAGRRHGRRVVPLRGPTGPSRLKLLADVGGGLEYPGGVSRERADLGSRVRLQG